MPNITSQCDKCKFEHYITKINIINITLNILFYNTKLNTSIIIVIYNITSIKRYTFANNILLLKFNME